MGLSLLYVAVNFFLFIYFLVRNVCPGASLTLSQTVGSLLRIQMALSVPFPPLKPSQPPGPSRLPPSIRLSIHPSLPSKVLLRIINSYHISWSSTPSRDTCSRSLKPANAAFVSKCPFCSPHDFHWERMPSAPKRAKGKKKKNPKNLGSCARPGTAQYSPLTLLWLLFDSKEKSLLHTANAIVTRKLEFLSFQFFPPPPFSEILHDWQTSGSRFYGPRKRAGRLSAFPLLSLFMFQVDGKPWFSLPWLLNKSVALAFCQISPSVWFEASFPAVSRFFFLLFFLFVAAPKLVLCVRRATVKPQLPPSLPPSGYNDWSADKWTCLDVFFLQCAPLSRRTVACRWQMSGSAKTPETRCVTSKQATD